ncbi:MAG: winged helix-turn-helix domain-containing protein [Pseudomonadota bacterium]
MIYRFDNFVLDSASHELLENGLPVAVEPQVLALINLLIAQRHRMVSKNEIIEQIWQGRFVSDAAMSSRVKSARQALGDSGKAQRLIKTVHGKGLRFVGEVQEESPQNSAPSSAAVRDQPNVVVLPFANQSNDPEQNYFANGVTQDIISLLSRYRWLEVVASNAARPYLDDADVMRSLIEHLDVDYVVEGSVRRAAQRVRVAVQLTDAHTRRHQWAETYDRDLQDVFALQDEITTTIAARLEPEIGYAERQRVARTPQRDLQAWDWFHLGVDHFFKFTEADNLAAQDYLNRSRELDPGFGEAHAWWAYAVVIGMVYWDIEASQALLDEALAATVTALSLDDRNAVFYALKARVQLARKEYASALVENEMAISLNPALASAHCGLADSLAYEGRYAEAIERFEHVIELSTNDPQRWAFYTYGALAMIFSGDYARAVQWCDQAMEIPNRQYWSIAHKMVAQAYLEDHAGMQRTRQLLLQEKPEFDYAFVRGKLFYLKHPEQLQCYLEGVRLCGFDN